MKKTKHDDISLHAIRKTFVVTVMPLGMDINVVKYMLIF